MRVAFYDHGGKGIPFAAALRDAGHDIVDSYSPEAAGADVALLDSDHHESVCDHVGRVVLYPHGGNVVARWDGRKPHPAVRLVMVPGVGHAQVMALHGLGVPVVPVGFPWCPLRPQQEPRLGINSPRVLFGPSHPLANGRIDERIAALNETLASNLARMPSTIGYMRKWEEGRGLSFDDIDRADVVIADGTLLALAVARGVPAVTFGQDIAPDLAHDGPPVEAASWNSWKERVRFPLDVDDGDDDLGLVRARFSPQTRAAVAEWRQAFVGGPLDTSLVVGLVERVAAT